MTDPHRIRLRGYWQRSPAAAGVAFARPFGRPRDGDRCFLSGDPLPLPAELVLNGESLARIPAGEPFLVPLPASLLSRNRVELRFPADTSWHEELLLLIAPDPPDDPV